MGPVLSLSCSYISCDRKTERTRVECGLGLTILLRQVSDLEQALAIKVLQSSLLSVKWISSVLVICCCVTKVLRLSNNNNNNNDLRELNCPALYA